METKDTMPGFYWRGVPSTDLTREELLGIIEYLSNELAEYRTPEAISAMAIGRVAALSRPTPGSKEKS